MGGYAKVFSRILDSTVWREDNPTRILWITMLAMADRDGMVYSTIPGLADRARISLEECELALDRFQKPDKYSWSTDSEGRRIERHPRGWFIINHAKYQAEMSVEQRRAADAERQRRHREALRSQKVTDVTKVTKVTQNHTLTDLNVPDLNLNQNSKSKALSHFVRPSLEEVAAYIETRGGKINPEVFMDYHEARGWKLKGGQTVKDWKACVRTWERNFNNPVGQTGSGYSHYESRDERRNRKNDEAFARVWEQKT